MKFSIILFVVGTNVGDISLWEVGSRERLVHKPFKVWDLQTASTPLQVLYSYGCIGVVTCFPVVYIVSNGLHDGVGSIRNS